MKDSGQLTAIVNATLLRPLRSPEPGCVLIRAGKIAEVGKERCPSLPRGAKKIDARRGYLSPGLIDLHLHGGGGRHFLDGDGGHIVPILQTHARFGTTSLLPTLAASSLSDTLAFIALVKKALRDPSVRGRVPGINLEGPFLSIGRRGAQPLRFLRPPRIKEVERILEAGRGLIRIMTIAPELDPSCRIIRALKRAGVIPAIGHTEADYETTLTALGAGLSYATHMFNSYPPFHHRHPGPLGAILESARVDVEIIADGIHVSPVLIRLLFRIKDPSRVLLVTDAVDALGARVRSFLMGGRTVKVRGAEARLDDGTMVGSVVPLNRAVRNLARFTGWTLPQALAHATLYPARLLGLEGRKGDLKPGQDADVVIWDKRFEPQRVLIAGETVYEK